MYACICIWPPLSFPVQAEEQFIQLRTLIQSSLEQASGAALRGGGEEGVYESDLIGCM